MLEEQLIVGLIKEKRKVWKGGSGRNLWKSLSAELTSHHVSIGRDKFFDLLRRNSLLRYVKKRKARTTDSHHWYRRYPNLVKGINPIKANEVWVSDITYVLLRNTDRFCYLFLITDMYSRKIMGFSVQPTLKAQGALQSLQMAIKTAGTAAKGCIHHSDRGIQYCCDAYTEFLTSKGLAISMTENGAPLDNAIAERVNKTIKEEFTDEREMSFTTLQQASKAISQFVVFYNSQRPHRSIDWLTPDEAYKRQGPLKRHWKSYYTNEGGIY
jgi:transposase InsO family protein